MRNRRCSAASIGFAEHGKYVVGSQRLVATPDQFQHPLAQGSQAQTALFAERFGGAQSATDTMAVIVREVGQWRVAAERLEHDAKIS